MRFIRIIFGIILFSIFYLNTNALNIEIYTDKNKVSLGEVFDLNIDIEGNVSSDFNLGEIKGLENFDIVNRSQSQSSASKVVVINGKTQSESKTIYNIHYTLQANKNGEFIIGPIILTNSGSNISTNSINITVSGKSLFGGSKNNNVINNSYKNNFDIFFEEDKASSDNIIIANKKEDYFDDFINIFKNIFFVILSFVPLFLLFYFFKNKEKFDKINFDNIKERFFIKDTIFKDKKAEKTFKKIEKEDVSEELYPSKYDKNFIYKLEDIFRKKLKNNYKIENISNKTYTDILLEIEDVDFYNKEKIKMLSNLFNKAKYSKIGVDKNEIVELIKKI